jgi:hypothetical protein
MFSDEDGQARQVRGAEREAGRRDTLTRSLRPEHQPTGTFLFSKKLEVGHARKRQMEPGAPWFRSICARTFYVWAGAWVPRAASAVLYQVAQRFSILEILYIVVNWRATD